MRKRFREGDEVTIVGYPSLFGKVQKVDYNNKWFYNVLTSTTRDYTFGIIHVFTPKELKLLTRVSKDV